MSRKYLSLLAVLVVPCILVGSRASGAERRVIIGFRNAPVSAEQAVVAGSKGKVTRKFRHVRAFVADVDDGELAALRTNPEVAYVEEDVVVRAIDPFAYGARTYGASALAPVTGGVEYESAWSVSLIGSQKIHARGVTGVGVKIGVLDTGVDYNHPDLAKNYVGGDNFVSLDPSYHDPFDDSYNSHGTHVAGTIAAELNGVGVVGVAPGASIYAIKAIDGAGFGSVSSVVAGIDWAVANQMDIVNMSIGFSTFSQALYDACAAAEEAGLLLVAAAGNNYGGPVLYPAAFPSVIAVGATTIFGEISPMSAVGPEIELTAPGLNVYSTIAYGDYWFLGGTSQAAPHVAGVAALLMSAGMNDIDGDGAVDSQDVRRQLRVVASDLGSVGVDPVYGYGLATATMPLRHVVVKRHEGDGGAQCDHGHGHDDGDGEADGDHERRRRGSSVSISDGVYRVMIVNTSLFAVNVAVFEAGRRRRDLSVKYQFGNGAPQQVSFVIDATGVTYDLLFVPKGRRSGVADAYIQIE